jgi:hypothetical protein
MVASLNELRLRDIKQISTNRNRDMQRSRALGNSTYTKQLQLTLNNMSRRSM